MFEQHFEEILHGGNFGGKIPVFIHNPIIFITFFFFFLRFSDSESYFVPPVSTVEAYMEYIDKLPITDDPEVFGMHENANINYQAQESDKIIQTILSIQPRLASGYFFFFNIQ